MKCYCSLFQALSWFGRCATKPLSQLYFVPPCFPAVRQRTECLVGPMKCMRSMSTGCHGRLTRSNSNKYVFEKQPNYIHVLLQYHDLMERGLYKAYAALIIDIICTVLFHQDVFCGYDEEKVYTYIFYRDTVIGALFLLFVCLHFDRKKYAFFETLYM